MRFRLRRLAGPAAILSLLAAVVLSLAAQASRPADRAGRPAPSIPSGAEGLRAGAAGKPEILPLSQVKPGMKGEVYTILEGDQIDAIELEVIGVMPNLLGPKQDIILVALRGPKAERVGVAFGMSGSPVYIAGKLAGALSLLMGIFAKEPLAGVTPIENVFAVGKAEKRTERAATSSPAPAQAPAGELPSLADNRYPLPAALAVSGGLSPDLASGAYLTPIRTPLVFSGFQPATLQQFGQQLSSYGLVAVAGGTAEARPDDADLKPGDMASMVLMTGDLSLQASCTVTAVVGDQVYVCGHPIFNFGSLETPMARGRVLTTLLSTLASAKIVNAGGIIGGFDEDRRTGVLGRLGTAPQLIPVELKLSTPTQEQQYRFDVMDHAKLTPLLVTIAVFNGLVGSTAYGEGMTFQLSGEIDVRNHSKVSLENMFTPTDFFLPDAIFVALTVQNIFSRIYSNPYERAEIQRVGLHITSIPRRRLAAIESAWSEKSEVSPGEQINVKVQLRPYRSAPVIQEVPITIPPQAARGTLRILVSDSETLNRMGRLLTLNPQTRLAGLEQLITLLNRERRNDRLYVTLLQPTPTLLVEDKELPNAPLSEINVLGQQRASGSSLLLRESTAGEWSVPMNEVISGQYILTIQVR